MLYNVFVTYIYTYTNKHTYILLIYDTNDKTMAPYLRVGQYISIYRTYLINYL